MSVLIVIIALGLLATAAFDTHRVRSNELGRFSRGSSQLGIGSNVVQDLDRFLENIGKTSEGNKSRSLKALAKVTKKNAAQLEAAGLEGFRGQGKFIVVQLFSYLSWPVICVLSWIYFTPYYATVSSLFSFGFIVTYSPVLAKTKNPREKRANTKRTPAFH